MADYLISTDSTLLDADFVARSLNTTYWAAGRTRAVIEKSIAGSLCFGAYIEGTKEQVAFARVVTDRSTFAWICDAFVDPGHRSRGLGKRLMSEIVQHPDLRDVTMYLGTKDAQGLYTKFGFTAWGLMRRGAPTAST
jgi:GNAT superfamily N-acetyltransferase